MCAKATIIMALIALAIVVAIKPVMASPDTYYLEEPNSLTTTSPSDPEVSQTITRGGTWTNTWLSESMQDVTISQGTYNFRFYIYSAPPGNISARVTFSFGYYDGAYHKIVEVGPTDITVPKTAALFNISGDGPKTDIPAGSRLYLTVSITNLDNNKNVYFLYSGSSHNTRIEIPAITVPEFPMGVFLFPPMLSALYLALRRSLLNSHTTSGFT